MRAEILKNRRYVKVTSFHPIWIWSPDLLVWFVWLSCNDPPHGTQSCHQATTVSWVFSPSPIQAQLTHLVDLCAWVRAWGPQMYLLPLFLCREGFNYEPNVSFLLLWWLPSHLMSSAVKVAFCFSHHTQCIAHSPTHMCSAWINHTLCVGM